MACRALAAVGLITCTVIIMCLLVGIACFVIVARVWRNAR
jgi:hypothetical protein